MAKALNQKIENPNTLTIRLILQINQSLFISTNKAFFHLKMALPQFQSDVNNQTLFRSFCMVSAFCNRLDDKTSDEYIGITTKQQEIFDLINKNKSDVKLEWVQSKNWNLVGGKSTESHIKLDNKYGQIAFLTHELRSSKRYCELIWRHGSLERELTQHIRSNLPESQKIYWNYLDNGVNDERIDTLIWFDTKEQLTMYLNLVFNAIKHLDSTK